MIKQVLFPFLLSLSISTSGQGYLILNNGQKIKFKWISEESTLVKIKEPGKKGNTEIAIGDLMGYYLNDEEEIYYPKEVSDSTSKKEYQFLRKIMSGKINLYEKAVLTSIPVLAPAGVPGAMVHSVVPLSKIKTYIEKSGRIEQIMTDKDILTNKRKKINLLKSFVDDDPASMHTLDDDFKFNYKNLLKVVEAYNVNTHLMEEEKGDGINYGKIIFYRTGKDLSNSLADLIRNSKNSDEDIHISICDSTYTLSNYSWIEISVPSERNLKACVGLPTSGCLIVSANAYFPTRFEVSQDNDSKLYTLYQKDSEARFVIDKLNKYKPRKRKTNSTIKN